MGEWKAGEDRVAREGNVRWKKGIVKRDVGFETELPTSGDPKQKDNISLRLGFGKLKYKVRKYLPTLHQFFFPQVPMLDILLESSFY